jgi:hypothetical protein
MSPMSSLLRDSEISGAGKQGANREPVKVIPCGALFYREEDAKTVVLAPGLADRQFPRSHQSPPFFTRLLNFSNFPSSAIP